VQKKKKILYSRRGVWYLSTADEDEGIFIALVASWYVRRECKNAAALLVFGLCSRTLWTL
jgi:hypothetical protein